MRRRETSGISVNYEAPAALFRAADGRNLSTLEALIRICSPVCGLRPLRALRLVMVKVPKLPIV